MSCSRARAALFVAVLLLRAAPSHSVERGQPLAAALEELRADGLQLVFSSALVDPAMSVTVDPGSGSPEEIARRILTPHGLTLEPQRSGLFAVVREQPGAAAQASAPRPASPTREPSEPLLEVDVYASRYEIEQNNPAALAELTREDLHAMPGLNQDVLRVTRYLPGTASSALSARTHVRGGREDELAVFFDGVPLFEPFHFKDVQGLLGILDPGAISGLNFYSGVFPVRYGNRLSGVLDIAPRAWMGGNYHELGASLLYSHLLTQGKLDSYPIEWLAAGRRSNVNAVADTLEGEHLDPNFFDALARIQLTAGERSTFALGWLLLDDELEADFTNGEERADIGYRDAMGWLSWHFRPSDNIETRTTVSLTERHTDRDGSLSRPSGAQGTLDDRRRFDTVATRFEGAARFSNRWHLYGGLEWYDYHARYNYESTVQFDPVFAAALGRPLSIVRDTALSVEGASYAAYASALVSLMPRLDLDFGLRWDGQRYGAAFHDDQVSPRVSFQYRYDPDTTLRLSWGRLAQTERPDELQVQDGDGAFHLTQRGTQTVVSLERRVRSRALLRVEAFDKRITDPLPIFENLLDPFALLPELEIDRVRVAPDRSRAYGAELSVRWDAREAWSGWGSYSWSETTDRFGGFTTPRTWNQRHSASVGASWTRYPWQLSANTTWHSGWRRNELHLVDTAPVSAPVLELSSRNGESWPNAFSLDMRASWKRVMRKGALEVFVEFDNVTNHENLCCVNYELSTAASSPALAADNSGWLPRFVLAGVTWELP